MGIALADTAAYYGAEVTLVLGPVERIPKNTSVKIIKVVSAQEMASECIAAFPGCDIAILSAAVADFTPAEISNRKIKREGEDILLKLKPTGDIAAALGQMKSKSQLLVGFALETHNEMANAAAKLKRKNLDLIVMNSLQDEGAGFGKDTNKVTLIDSNNIIDKFELKSKEKVARDILDKIVALLKS